MIKKYGETVVAVVIASAISYFAAATLLQNVTSELITFLGIQAAAILPAMIFAAGLLRPATLKLSEAKKYNNAIQSQMHFWITLLVVDILAVITVLVAKTMDWQAFVVMPSLSIDWNISWVFNFAILSLLFIAITRIRGFVVGILSLVKLNAKMLEGAILARESNDAEELVQSSKPFKAAKDFGKEVRH